VVGIIARSNTNEHTNGHVHCDPNRNTDCYTYVITSGLSPAASQEPLVIVDIMLVAAHWGETCE